MKPTPGREVDDELDFHLEMRTRELRERGLDQKAAAEAARARFGDFDGLRRTCRAIAEGRDREMRRREWLVEVRQDLGFAWRQMLKNPGFTAVAVGTLALGMGATAAIFSALYAVVLRPLPFPRPDEIVFVGSALRGGQPGSLSAGNYLYVREHSRSFRALAAVQYSSFTLAEVDDPERVLGARVTHDHFYVFAVPPLLGRVFTAEEDQPGHEQVAVLSHRLWTRRFGADPSVVGRQVMLSGLPHDVIGVMPASFDLTANSEELWVPMAFTAERRLMYDEHVYRVNGRLAPGLSMAQAAGDLARVSESLLRDHPRENQERALGARSFAETIVGVYRERLWLLLGAVVLVLLIACANVASLLLARGAARGRELAVRAALGAGRARLVRQMLTESLLLATLGGLAGLGVAQVVVALILRGSPPGVPRLDQVRIDLPVLAFTAGVALVTSIMFGLVPALRASRQDVRGDLGAGGRGTVLGGARDRLRRALVAAEVALCLVLLAGAGLLIRSALKLQEVDPGFDPRGVLSARVTLPATAYPGHERPARAFERLVARLREAPGVAAAAAASAVPLAGGGGGSNGLIPEGRPLDPKSAIDAPRHIVMPGYLEAMRVPLRRGRRFTADDRRGAPRVMIVNETLARAAWPGEDPIGKRIACCEGTPEAPGWKTVVGVVADVGTRGPGAEVRPEFYLPMDQIPEAAWEWIQRGMTVVVRAEDGVPEALTPLVRQAVREMDPTVAVFNVATMPERLRDATAQARFNTLLLTALGAVGLVLAAVGIYGVIAYFVAQRTREIGVRMALGATGRDVLGLVLRQGMTAVVAGVVAGIPAALLAGRALRAMLFGVGAGDPLTLAAVVAVLLTVALVASGVPARRAVRVQPTRALAD